MPAQDLKPDVPPTLDAICSKAMAVRQEDRYQSVRALEADIESWLADEPVQGVVEPFARRLSTWERKHRTFLRVSGMALIVVALVSMLAAIGVNAARERADERRLKADELSRVAESRKQEADRQRDALRRVSTRLTLDRGLSLLASNNRLRGRALARPEPGKRTRAERSVRAGNSSESRGVEPACASLEGLPGTQKPGAGGCLESVGPAIATGSDDGIVRIWDPTSSAGSPLELKHAGKVRALAFARDGRTLATGSDDQTARLWNSASGLPRGEPMSHRGPVVSVAFSPDDSTLVTGSEDGTVRLWNVLTGDPRGKPFVHGKPLKSVALAVTESRLPAWTNRAA